MLNKLCASNSEVRLTTSLTSIEAMQVCQLTNHSIMTSIIKWSQIQMHCTHALVVVQYIQKLHAENENELDVYIPK